MGFGFKEEKYGIGFYKDKKGNGSKGKHLGTPETGQSRMDRGRKLRTRTFMDISI